MSILFLGCIDDSPNKEVKQLEIPMTPYAIVLGIAQDAGYPQAACKKDCCKVVWQTPELRRSVSCLAIVDPMTKESWILDATPDFKDQLYRLQNHSSNHKYRLSGILLTHAHIGHYTGLMHLGREVMGAKQVPVYVMPKMRNYLANNGPWSQLVKLKNIVLEPLTADSIIALNDRIKVQPMLVPHRDEFSETVGFKIFGPDKSLLFIPDIDKWHLWNRDIKQEIMPIDYAFLDGTFFENGEIPGRDMREIPHPFIRESIEVLKALNETDRNKVHFIHFNHTNPLLYDATARKSVEEAGYQIANEMDIHPL